MPLDPSIVRHFKPTYELPDPLDQQHKMLTLAGLLQQQDERQRALADDLAIKRAMEQAGSPEAAIPLLIKQGPRGIKLAGILAEATKDLRNPQTRGQVVAPGGALVDPAGRVLYQAPYKPEHEATPPEIVRLQSAMQKLPEGSPMRAQIEARIKMLTTPNQGLTVNMPASAHLMQGPEGKFVQVRVGKDGKVEYIPLGDMRPPLTPGERKEKREEEEHELTVANVRSRVAKMAALIQGGAMAGGVVGPLGVASRIGETALGAVNKDLPTPALDFKNQQAILIADIRKLVERDPNLSNQERQTLMETLGGGWLQTDASGIRALNNVLDFVEHKKIVGPSRGAQRERKRALAVGTIEDGYRFKGGDPSKRENWEKAN